MRGSPTGTVQAISSASISVRLLATAIEDFEVHRNPNRLRCHKIHDLGPPAVGATYRGEAVGKRSARSVEGDPTVAAFDCNWTSGGR